MISCIITFVLSTTGFGEIADRKPSTDVVEILRDAQATLRDSWKRGQATVHFETSNGKKKGLAQLDGEVRWGEENFTLKYRLSDPEGVQFIDRPVSREGEWDFAIFNATLKTITYNARHNVLNERATTPNAMEPFYHMTPLVVFGRCVGIEGRPWQDMIGPSATTPAVFQSSKFTHEISTQGDITQTRVDETGFKVVTVFSAVNQLAVRSSISYSPDGKIHQTLIYEYGTQPDGKVVPLSFTRTMRNQVSFTDSVTSFRFSDVRLPGDVTPGEFQRDPALARIRRETPYGQAKAADSAKIVNDALLDKQAKSLKDGGLARPKP